MRRCLELATNGEGYVQPNPMVGAVVVHNNIIIGEGFHRCFGEPHAEVNAINQVKNQSLLRDSTLYVSLEPCSHYGKTPPCAKLIIDKKIPNVVIATADPNPKVAGKGIAMLREQGVNVVVGLMQEEAQQLNRIFFVNQLNHRPYIVLKWAQSADGFMDAHRTAGDGKAPMMLSNDITQCMVHKYRSNLKAIMVGTNTALLDNPNLTVRKWAGNNPTRVVLDRTLSLPQSHHLFDGSTPTMVFTASTPPQQHHPAIEFVQIDFDNQVIHQVLGYLYFKGISSILVEGGAKLLTSFIDDNLWDEALVESSSVCLGSGVKAPVIDGTLDTVNVFLQASQRHLINPHSKG